MGRRLADLPELSSFSDARRLINDRLQRIEGFLSTAEAGVTLQEVNAQIAALAARLEGKIAAIKGTPAAAEPVTVTGGQVVLSIPGTLAIESNAAALVAFKDARRVSEVELLVKQAPLGSTLEVRVRVDGATMATVTLTAGQTGVKSAASFAIAVGKPVRIDILNVGTTFPGADLSVILRY
jgi:hypothetical protein